MKANARSPTRRNVAFHKYLKPGALAQLRDSKINARSHRPNSIVTQFLQSAPNQGQIPILDQIPGFLEKIRSGRGCLRRKKLVAARSGLLLNLNPSGLGLETSGNSSSNGANSVENLLINAVNNDVVAH